MCAGLDSNWSTQPKKFLLLILFLLLIELVPDLFGAKEFREF